MEGLYESKESKPQTPTPIHAKARDPTQRHAPQDSAAHSLRPADGRYAHSRRRLAPRELERFRVLNRRLDRRGSLAKRPCPLSPWQARLRSNRRPGHRRRKRGKPDFQTIGEEKDALRSRRTRDLGAAKVIGGNRDPDNAHVRGGSLTEFAGDGGLRSFAAIGHCVIDERRKEGLRGCCVLPNESFNNSQDMLLLCTRQLVHLLENPASFPNRSALSLLAV